MHFHLLPVIIFSLLFVNDVRGALKRCYRCRSRGGLGDCKDPFFGVTTPVKSQTANPLQIPGNAANLQTNVGVDAIPCSSGWCVKYIEGNGNFHSDDHSMATERGCLQRPPTDNKERCAKTLRRNQEVYVCYCNGDLCNSSGRLNPSHIALLLSAVVAIFVKSLI